MSNNIFQLETFARNGFMVRIPYVKITGDLVAGILLGQIVYWNMPNEKGESKLKVKKNGEYWLAKGREDWYEEICITAKQYDRAIKILIDKGFVEVNRFKFDGAPTIHIKLNINKVTERVKSIFTNGEVRNEPLGNLELDQTVKSLTEITTETTTEIKEYIVEIVNYLNSTCEKNYRTSTKKTQTLIKARLAEGYTVEQFKKVIDIKKSHWFKDPNMDEYLRPETLFGTKFESYLNSKPKTKQHSEMSAEERLEHFQKEAEEQDDLPF